MNRTFCGVICGVAVFLAGVDFAEAADRCFQRILKGRGSSFETIDDSKVYQVDLLIFDQKKPWNFKARAGFVLSDAPDVYFKTLELTCVKSLCTAADSTARRK